MVVAVVCIVWLTLGLPLALVLGRALRRADLADRRGLPVAEDRSRPGLRAATGWLATG
ncbi:hypothetical protein ACI79J_09150 [Geodermatophilus sp. SYSU D01062]